MVRYKLTPSKEENLLFFKLSSTENLSLLWESTTQVSEIIPVGSFSYDDKELKSYHNLIQKFKADKVFQLIKDKVEIREGSVGGQKFILTETNQVTNYFMLVPHDLNLISLGVMSAEQPMFLNSFVDTSNQYLSIFDNVWNSSKKDLKENILKSIVKAAQHYSPEELYKFTLHNIFQNKTIDEISEQRLSRTGFKETEVWKMLFNFHNLTFLHQKREIFNLL